jgi:hypothetical protein
MSSCRKNDYLTHICGPFDDPMGINQEDERDWIGIMTANKHCPAAKLGAWWDY